MAVRAFDDGRSRASGAPGRRVFFASGSSGRSGRPLVAGGLKRVGYSGAGGAGVVVATSAAGAASATTGVATPSV